jgi:hypothetical protein
MLHQAAWYQDRDNSMTPVSTDEGVGAAMATIFTRSGDSQAVQVCPGVYLATAHGVLDDPSAARREGRAVETPSGNMYGMSPYPLSRETLMTARNDSSYISPRLRDPSNWSDPTTDYVFITVDNPIRPNDFVRPVRSSDQRLIEASNSGEMDVHLYRPQTRFNTDRNGTPDFNVDTWASDFDELQSLYQSPMRVNQPCSASENYGLIGTNCPTEQTVSGSPYTAEISGNSYLMGMHIKGDLRSYDSMADSELPNGYIQSSHFCEDYESVCGQPCAELDEVLPQNDDGISI